jgi:probable phosphoglycerate mutase
MSGEIVYMIRHGQTEWNRLGILQGQTDSPLTALGERQAQAVGERLARLLPDPAEAWIESSPLGRARATAEIVRRCLGLDKARLSVDALLAEIHLGEWQGLDQARIEERWPGLLAARERDRWHFRVPGGENYPDLQARARRWLERKRLARVTVAVAHQQIGNALRGWHGKLTPAETLRLVHGHESVFCLREGGGIECCGLERPRQATTVIDA